MVEAYRSGAGVPYACYGGDFRVGQGGINRPAFTHDLPGAWRPAITLHRYADEAGFAQVEILLIDNELFRFYLLRG